MADDLVVVRDTSAKFLKIALPWAYTALIQKGGDPRAMPLNG